MSDIGMIPVDWEARFDPQRMVRERLQRAKDALKALATTVASSLHCS